MGGKSVTHMERILSKQEADSQLVSFWDRGQDRFEIVVVFQIRPQLDSIRSHTGTKNVTCMGRSGMSGNMPRI